MINQQVPRKVAASSKASAARLIVANRLPSHSAGNPGANLKSIPHRCYPILTAFEWELTKHTIDVPLGCLQGGE